MVSRIRFSGFNQSAYSLKKSISAICVGILLCICMNASIGDVNSTKTFDTTPTIISSSGVNPAIAACGNDVYIVWEQDTTIGGVTSTEIRFSWHSNSGDVSCPSTTQWVGEGTSTQATPISGLSGVDSVQPDIAVSENWVHVVWIEREIPTPPVHSRIWYTYSMDKGANWQTPRPLYDFALFERWGTSKPSIAVSDNSPSVAHVAWTMQCTLSEGPMIGDNFWQNVYYIKVVDGVPHPLIGGKVSNPIKENFHEGAPDIAVFGEKVHVVWSTFDTGTKTHVWKIRYRYSKGDGTWKDIQRLSPLNVDSYTPALAVEGGNVHVVWMDERFGSRCNIYYLNNSRDGVDGYWEPEYGSFSSPGNPRPGRLVGTASSSIMQYYPDIAVDKEIHVVWVDSRNWNGGAGTIDLCYAYSTDNGNSFHTDQCVGTSTPAISEPWFPAIASDMGNVHITYHFDPNTLYAFEIGYLGARDDYEWHSYKHKNNNDGYTRSLADKMPLNAQANTDLGVLASVKPGASNQQLVTCYDTQPIVYDSGTKVLVAFNDADSSGGFSEFNTMPALSGGNPTWSPTATYSIGSNMANTFYPVRHTPALEYKMVADTLTPFIYFGGSKSASSGSSELYCVEMFASAKVDWYWSASKEVFYYSSPTIETIDWPGSSAGEKQLLYIGGVDGTLYCFDTADPIPSSLIHDNGPLWTFTPYPGEESVLPIHSTPAFWANDFYSSRDISYPYIPDTERIIFAGTNGIIYCADANPDDNFDGVLDSNDVDEGIGDQTALYDIIWKFDTGETISMQSPVVIHNRVYIGTDDGSFFCLDANGNFNPTQDDGVLDPTPNQYTDSADVLWYYQRGLGSDYTTMAGWSDAVVHHGKVFAGVLQYHDNGLSYDMQLEMFTFDEYSLFEDTVNDLSLPDYETTGGADIVSNVLLIPDSSCSDEPRIRSPVIADQKVMFAFCEQIYIIKEYDSTRVTNTYINTYDDYSPSQHPGKSPSLVVTTDFNGDGRIIVPSDEEVYTVVMRR